MENLKSPAIARSPARLLLALGVVLSWGCESSNGVEVGSKTAEPVSNRISMQGDATQPVTQKMHSRVEIPERARRLLEVPMRRHADDMMALLLSSVVLDYDATMTRARRMAAEPRVTRPDWMTEDAFAITLPRRYIQEEGLLYNAAAALESAASARDAAAMSKAYLQMAATCIRCHSSYLRVDEYR